MRNTSNTEELRVEQVRSSRDLGRFIYNALTNEIEDLVASGVIDPAKVTKSALVNAASIAGLMLTTEALVAEIPEEKKDGPAMPSGGGMDMY